MSMMRRLYRRSLIKVVKTYGDASAEYQITNLQGNSFAPLPAPTATINVVEVSGLADGEVAISMDYRVSQSFNESRTTYYQWCVPLAVGNTIHRT